MVVGGGRPGALAAAAAVAALNVGTAGVETVFVGRGVGRPDTERFVGVFGIDIPEAAEPGLETLSSSAGTSGSDLRVLAMGNAGSGPLGGGCGGRELDLCGSELMFVAMRDIHRGPYMHATARSPKSPSLLLQVAVDRLEPPLCAVRPAIACSVSKRLLSGPTPSCSAAMHDFDSSASTMALTREKVESPQSPPRTSRNRCGCGKMQGGDSCCRLPSLSCPSAGSRDGMVGRRK